MTIDTTGEWWKGSSLDDIEEYLKLLKPEGYEVHEYRRSKCQCGSLTFKLEFNSDEGSARRICVKCNFQHYLCDSQEYWDDDEYEELLCPDCHETECNIGAGYSLYDDDPSGIRWISIGVRCSNCGLLGSPVNCKVAISDVRHLLDKA
ncbi:hypothetical protein ACFL27_05155 [candidate division CSSED10-310 bacterium]|uniref:Uncharacterized protein n=1 Tax=candidate division CSSED10-310 bacterium TaxID=2855610 RepID=A0ABV6YTP3_UNCC1